MVIFIMVAYTISTESSTNQEAIKPLNIAEDQRKVKSVINHVVRRIVLYIIIPPATTLGNIVSEIWLYSNMEFNYPLNVWSVTAAALPGVLNFVAFLMDPAVMNAMEMIKKYKSLHFVFFFSHQFSISIKFLIQNTSALLISNFSQSFQ